MMDDGAQSFRIDILNAFAFFKKLHNISNSKISLFSGRWDLGFCLFKCLKKLLSLKSFSDCYLSSEFKFL
jgi:hypothetical protein